MNFDNVIGIRRIKRFERSALDLGISAAKVRGRVSLTIALGFTVDAPKIEGSIDRMMRFHG